MKVSPGQQLVDQEFLLPQSLRDTEQKCLRNSRKLGTFWNHSSENRFQEQHRCIDQPRRHTRFGWRKPHASGVPPGKWGKPEVFKQISQIDSTGTLVQYPTQTYTDYVNECKMHRSHWLSSTPIFILPRVFNDITQAGATERANLFQKVYFFIIHGLNLLSWHLCNVDHDWFISSWHIDSISWWLVHSYRLMPWSQLLHHARGLCTPGLRWRFAVEITYESATEGEHRTNSMPAQPGKLQNQNKYYTMTYNDNGANDSRQNDLQTMRLTIAIDYALSSSNRFKGVSGEWNEETIKTATELTCLKGWSHQFRHTNPSNKPTTVWHPFANFSQSFRTCNWCPCRNTPSNPVAFSFQRLLVAIRAYGEHCCKYTAGTLLNGNHYATSIVEEATVHDLLPFCLLDCPPYPCTNILLSNIYSQTQVTCESLKTMLVQQVANHTPGYCTTL